MPRRHTPSQTQFLKDVKHHVLRVRLDRGLHRSLRLQKPGMIHLYFDINTWPGFLSISGDMGDYTFARIPDMFEFFRASENRSRLDRRKLPINLGYWHEKVQAEDRHGGVEEWSAAKFKRTLYSYMFTHSWPRAVREEAEDEVLRCEHDGEFHFTEAAYNFRSDYKGKRYEFVDLWDYGDAKVYTYHYVWCCYAIVWAIQRYDAWKARNLIPTAVEFSEGY